MRYACLRQAGALQFFVMTDGRKEIRREVKDHRQY